ncbi:MAG: flagellar protein FliS [Sphingopyxis sp.]|jgi:flagellar protein FliS|nr:flagellar protein FliS [Sphingopyxis sp.]
MAMHSGFIPSTAGHRSAADQYRRIAIASRVEGARREELVAILYDEAISAIDMMIAALDHSDTGMVASEYVRAFGIIQELEASIDFARGGDVAMSLATIYRAAHAGLVEARQTGATKPAVAARDLLADIAHIWQKNG